MAKDDDHPPFAAGSETSAAAAEAIVPSAAQLRSRVLRYVHWCGEEGATCWEVERALGLSHQTASPRIWELKDLALLLPTDRRRKTGSGRRAVVLVAPRLAAPVGAPRAPTLRVRVRALEAELAARDRVIERLRMQLALQGKRRATAPLQMPLRGMPSPEEESS